METNRAFLLLVGDRAQIEPGLRELGVGEVVLLDREGAPVAEGTQSERE